MTFQMPVLGRITSKWNEPRPLSSPGKHVHGAIDIAAAVNARIVAPESGTLYAFQMIRPPGAGPWYDRLRVGGDGFPWVWYFYDIFGAPLVLQGKSNLVHLFVHSYINQVFNRNILPKSAWDSQEESKDKQFPMFLYHTFGYLHQVRQGQQIGYVGNAGYSTGAHVHWEIHNKWEWTDYADRIDPENYLE